MGDPMSPIEAARILSKLAADKVEAQRGDSGYARAFRMGADALLAAQRLLDRVAELEQENVELKELLDDIPEHIIQVRAETFTLKHPLSCRPNLFDCPFNEAGRDLDGPPAPLGCYVVTLDEAGGLVIGEAVDG